MFTNPLPGKMIPISPQRFSEIKNTFDQVFMESLDGRSDDERETLLDSAMNLANINPAALFRPEVKRAVHDSFSSAEKPDFAWLSWVRATFIFRVQDEEGSVLTALSQRIACSFDFVGGHPELSTTLTLWRLLSFVQVYREHLDWHDTPATVSHREAAAALLENNQEVLMAAMFINSRQLVCEIHKKWKTQ